MLGYDQEKPNMVTIFIYYTLGFAIFLAVTYLCIQLGWLFEAEGRISFRGLAGLSIFLVSIFVFITFVCSVQLSGWKPPALDEGLAISKKIRAQMKDFDVLDSMKKVKERLSESGREITETVGELWEDELSLGLFLPTTQGATAVNMLIQDISAEGFLNRLNPINLVNFRKEGKDVGKAETQKTGLEEAKLTEEEKQRRADQETFRIRVEAIEKQFNVQLKIPDTVLPEQLRRIEEIYLAVTTGTVTYPYLRFEFPFLRNKALNFLQKYEKKKIGQKLALKVPVVIEVFGYFFDLGMCTLNFPNAHVDPSLEKARLSEQAQNIRIRIMPNQKPGQILAKYEKFQSDKKDSEKTEGSSNSEV